jgi:hypothetical protein
LATAFFAQLLQAVAKDKPGGNLGSPSGVQTQATKIAKDVQKKTAGSGWGEGDKSMRIWVRTFFVAVGR